MAEQTILVENISKVYRLYDAPIERLKESLSLKKKMYHKEFYALNDVSFEVNKGEIVGLIGKNGSGKSTILKIITGVVSQTDGDISVNGKISALLELGAGFNLEYTGIENVFLNGMMLGFTRDEMEKKLEDIIEFADIGDFISQPVKSYSSGMFARLAFSVAINVDPEILIVDEALAVGDLRFQLKCMEKFSEFRDKGKTILFVSHDINSIKRYCTRVIWLNEGRIEAQGDTDLICDRYTDYLKYDNEKSKEYMFDTQLEDSEKLELLDKDVVGVIDKVTLLNQYDEEIYEVDYGSVCKLKIKFLMNIDELDIVIGAAIHTIDNLYVCGLNTLLDKKYLKYKIGMNTIVLEYEDFNLLGGSYYFDVAIFEKNAHVPIDYKAKIFDFFVKSPYIGEGICVLSHDWKMRGETNEI